MTNMDKAMILYHGTSSVFTKFAYGRYGDANFDHETLKWTYLNGCVYFTDRFDVAAHYAPWRPVNGADPRVLVVRIATHKVRILTADEFEESLGYFCWNELDRVVREILDEGADVVRFIGKKDYGPNGDAEHYDQYITNKLELLQIVGEYHLDSQTAAIAA